MHSKRVAWMKVIFLCSGRNCDQEFNFYRAHDWPPPVVDLRQEYFRFADSVGYYVAQRVGRLFIEKNETWSGEDCRDDRERSLSSTFAY